MKTCSQCKQLKGLSEFYKHPKSKDGLQWVCKECSKKNSKLSRRLSRKDMSQIVSLNIYGKTWGQMFPLLRGLATSGKCCDLELVKWGNTLAHCHNEHEDSEYGWICFRADVPIVNAAGQPSEVFLHEYAHLCIYDDDHTAEWRNAYRYLLKEFGHKWTGRLTVFN